MRTSTTFDLATQADGKIGLVYPHPDEAGLEMLKWKSAYEEEMKLRLRAETKLAKLQKEKTLDKKKRK
jgi:hypothetical protein